MALTAGMMGGDPVALCVTQQGGLTIFDVSDPYRPRLRLRRDEPGLRGALLWSGEVLAWGRHGLRRLSGAEPQTLMDRAISAVRASGATLVVEDECGALYLFDTRLRRSTNAPTQQRPRTRRAGWLAEAATVGRTWLRSDRSTIEVWHATRSVTPD